MKNTIKLIAPLLLVMIAILTGCYKDRRIVDLPATTTTGTTNNNNTNNNNNNNNNNNTGDVSFSKDILPIFTTCAHSGCHVTGGKKPDLTAANAYASLQSGNYINTADPANSELYLWMSGKKALTMPPDGADSKDNAKVLDWIKQGAKNN